MVRLRTNIQASVNGIPTWKDYHHDNKVAPIPSGDVCSNLSTSMKNILNKKVSLWNGNITLLSLDAIVNATNISLKDNPPGSVADAILKSAGPQLATHLERYGVRTAGNALITPGYNLNAIHVIHTVSPTDGSELSLAQCYRNSLERMLGEDLRTIAFPCIATGASGFPKKKAAVVAVRETWKFLTQNHQKIDRVVFCTFVQEDTDVYEEILQRYFPI